MSYIFAKILAKFMCLGKWAKTKRLIQPSGCLRVNAGSISTKQKEGKKKEQRNKGPFGQKKKEGPETKKKEPTKKPKDPKKKLGKKEGLFVCV